MTKLVVRKIPWEFDASVPFMWQPANPNFGLFCNAFTFIAVPFERYIANLEATFTPLFKVILDNRDSLFGGGDTRVASLMMWHFVEEIEHRSSGLKLCRHINPNPWYRVRHIRGTFNHVGKLSRCCSVSSGTACPAAGVGATVRPRYFTPFPPVNWSQWSGDWRCRRRRITIRPTNRCQIGRTPGCANTSGVVT